MNFRGQIVICTEHSVNYDLNIIIITRLGLVRVGSSNSLGNVGKKLFVIF